jgi:hypothetical protein
VNRRPSRSRTVLSIVVGVAAALGPVAAASAGPDRVPIAIIVSADWASMSKVSIRELQSAYLRRSKRLLGVTVQPVDHPTGSAIYDAFLKQVLKKSRKVLEDHWLEQALTGGTRPPRQIENLQAMIDFVARTVGAVAYVGLDELDIAGTPGVKIVPLAARDGAVAPSEPGYALSYTKE